MLYLARCIRQSVSCQRLTAATCSTAVRQAGHLSVLLLPSSTGEWSSELRICHDEYRKKLQVIIERLKAHLDQQKWPKTTHMELAGRQYRLPVRFDDLDLHLVSEMAKGVGVEYLAGFFDGDGCVSAQTSLSGCALQVGQSTSNIKALLLFATRFGGTIGINNHGRGSMSPTASWNAYGELARQAAIALHPHSLVKKEQLTMVNIWPSSRCQRELCKRRLKNLKEAIPSIPSELALSWSYVAGFFDAEGCIYIDRVSKSVQLIIGQKDVPVLVAIQQFWMKQLPLGHETRLYRKKNCSHLVSRKTETSVIILERLVEHGLQNKRAAALCAMQGNSLSHSDLRRHVGNHQGKQSYFSRLDEDGCTRARLIRSLRSRLWSANAKASGAASAESLHAELCLANIEHNVRNAQTHIIKLRELIATIRHMRTQTISLPSQSPSVISA